MKSKLHARRAFWPGAISTLLVAFVLAMLGATPAFAHHPEFTVTVECNHDGTWNARYKGFADAVRDLEMKIDDGTAPGWGPEEEWIDDDEFFYKEVLNIPNSTATLNSGLLKVKWSNNATGSGSKTASRPAGCNIPTATPIPPTNTPEPLPIAVMVASSECLADGWRGTYTITSTHNQNQFRVIANAETYQPPGWQADTGAFVKTTEVLGFAVPAFFEATAVEWDNAAQTMQGVSAMAERPEDCVQPTNTPEPSLTPTDTPEPTSEPTVTDPAPSETPAGGDGTETPVPSLTPTNTLVASETPDQTIFTPTARPTEPPTNFEVPVYSCDNVEVPYEGTELQYTTGDSIWHFGAYLNAGRLVLAQGSAPHGAHFRLVYGGIVLVEFTMNQGQCEWAQTFSQVTPTPAPEVCPECDAYFCETELGDDLITPYWDWKHGLRYNVRSTSSFPGAMTYIDVNGVTRFFAHRLTASQVLNILTETTTEFALAGEITLSTQDGVFTLEGHGNAHLLDAAFGELLKGNSPHVQVEGGQCSKCQHGGWSTRVVDGVLYWWIGYGGTPYDLAEAIEVDAQLSTASAHNTAKYMYQRFHDDAAALVAAGMADPGFAWYNLEGERLEE